MALTRIGNQAITLDAAEIPNLDAAKITTGTLANARIAEASVTQHVTATDLQPVKSDISALALREATNESSVAFNLPNQFIDTFTDDTNLGTQTTVDRTSGHIATAITSSADASVTIDNSNYSTYFSNGTTMNFKRDASGYAHTTGASGNDSSDSLNDIWATDGTTKFQENSASTYMTYWFDFGATRTFDISAFSILHHSGEGNLTEVRFFGYNAPLSASVYTTQSASTLSDYELFTNVSGSPALGNATTWSGSSLNANDDFYRYIGMSRLYGGGQNWGEFRSFSMTGVTRTDTTTTNATGTLIQSANAVGSAKTKVGGTMLYKDNAGTATIGTDLKIYFTCDGGSNWTEATSYNAITPVYSTGVKQVRLGETTCTSGTDVRYKAVWANQSEGSKETQLHGIGVNY